MTVNNWKAGIKVIKIASKNWVGGLSEREMRGNCMWERWTWVTIVEGKKEEG